MNSFSKLSKLHGRGYGSVASLASAASIVAILMVPTLTLAQRPNLRPGSGGLSGGGANTGGLGTLGTGTVNNPAQGTWTPLTNACPEDPETALLLTDGTLFVKSFDNFQHNFKLTPGVNGDYTNGVWSKLADAPVGMLYGPCQVLKDGRVFLAGGEYLSPGQTDHNSCQVYDPTTDKWVQGPDGLFGDIGDTGNSILTDGRILVSTRFSMATQIWDPSTDTWSATGTMTNFTGDEESWQLLADGSVLNVFNIGQRYIPSTGAWVNAGTIPVNLVDSAFEIGPANMLYSGKIITLGGTPNTAIYTPGASGGAGTWVAGPVIPDGNGAPDCAGSVEPDGKLLFIGTPTDFAAPFFYEYDPTTNTMASITGPANTFDEPSYTPRFLNLPNGQILMTGWGPTCWLYTPAGSPQNAWRASLSTLVRNGSVYTLTGQNLNGFTLGGAYGDDAVMDTNYPIVQLKNKSTGKSYYARSFNFSTCGIETGTTPVSCNFTIPSNVPQGDYTVTTWASGVQSSNGLAIGTAITPTAVSIYNNQGQSATGGITQLLHTDQTYYTVNSVSNSVGEVAAAQITFNIGSSSGVGNLAAVLVAQAPKSGTNFVYFWNYTSNQFDLVNTSATDGTDHTISGTVSNPQNYVNSKGVVIVVDRAVFPPRLNAPIYTLKLDFASVTD